MKMDMILENGLMVYVKDSKASYSDGTIYEGEFLAGQRSEAESL